MSNDPTRILTLLSTSGIPASEIRAFLEWVAYSKPDDVYKSYSKIRNQLRHIDLDWSDSTNLDDRTNPARHETLVRDIQRLHAETGYSVSETVDKISNHLLKRFPDSENPAVRFSTKEGFRRWLARIATDFGESVVLSAAVEALSKRSQQPLDWRLS